MAFGDNRCEVNELGLEEYRLKEQNIGDMRLLCIGHTMCIYLNRRVSFGFSELIVLFQCPRRK